MNFKAMQDRVKYTLGAEEITSNDELALIKDFLNDGVVAVLVRTRPYTRKIELVLTASTPIHDMSAEILSLVDVEIPGVGFLKRHSREDITRMQAEGSYGFAYEEPLFWFSPVPSETQAISAYGIFRPQPMSGDTDNAASPTYGGLNPEFHEAVITYALWKMAEYVQHTGSGEGEKWRLQYEGQDGTEGEIAKIKRVLSKRVTPQASFRRDVLANLGSLSESGSYHGAT